MYYLSIISYNNSMTTVRQKLKSEMIPGRVYRTRELKQFSNNLARDLEYLVETKELIRPAPGLYYGKKGQALFNLRI